MGEIPIISEKKKFWLPIVISAIGVLIACLSLYKSCESNKISKKAYEEPKICIKEFKAIKRTSPVDIYSNIYFKVDKNFKRTLNKIIKDNIENSLIIMNDGPVVASPIGDIPSAKIKISTRFPYRIFSAGVIKVPEENWRWKITYEQDKSQICIINIYEDFLPEKEITTILLYYVEEKEELGVNQILSKYFEVSTWSPRSQRSRECLWKEGVIKKPKTIFDN